VFTPVVVPRVDTKPVIKATLISPADNLNGVASILCTSHVVINSWRVGQEIFINSKCCGHCTMSVDFLFDIFNPFHSILRNTLDFVSSIVDWSFARAGGSTNWVNCWSLWAWSQTCYCNVMSTHWHGVIVTVLSLTVWTTSNHTSSLKPREWGWYLTTITTIREARSAIAASCSIRNGKQFLEWSIWCNAKPVIECFSCCICPAGATICLISD